MWRREGRSEPTGREHATTSFPCALPTNDGTNSRRECPPEVCSGLCVAPCHACTHERRGAAPPGRLTCRRLPLSVGIRRNGRTRLHGNFRRGGLKRTGSFQELIVVQSMLQVLNLYQLQRYGGSLPPLQILRGNAGSRVGLFTILRGRTAHVSFKISQPGTARARSAVNALRA
jgi:hypothetical protein